MRRHGNGTLTDEKSVLEEGRMTVKGCWKCQSVQRRLKKKKQWDTLMLEGSSGEEHKL